MQPQGRCDSIRDTFVIRRRLGREVWDVRIPVFAWAKEVRHHDDVCRTMCHASIKRRRDRRLSDLHVRWLNDVIRTRRAKLRDELHEHHVRLITL